MSGNNGGEGAGIGARLRALRLERFPNETAEDVAKRCRVHPVTLSNVERGRQEPSLDTCRKLAEGYGVPLALVVGE